MGRLIKVTESEAAVQREIVSKAVDRLNVHRQARKRFQDAYKREPLGNEKEGRAAIIASDVHDRVESQHPFLMRRFMATDPRIVFTGPDPMTCKIAKVLCRETIYDQNGFRLFTDALKDGAINDLGVAKVFWRRIWGEPETMVSLGADNAGLTAPELEKIAAGGRFKILKLIELTGGEIEIPAISEEEGEPSEFVINPELRYAAVVRHRPLKESGPVIECLPSEEFCHEAGKRRMDDRKGCGHIREMTVGEILREQERLSLPGEPYYRNLEQALRDSNDGSIVSNPNVLTEEADDRTAYHYDPDDAGGIEGNAGSGELNLRAKRWVVEWAGWTVSGRKLIPSITTHIGKVIVRCEENEEGIVPFVAFSPIPHPHSLIGSGNARLHADDQDYHTQLLRAFHDSVGFYVDRVLVVDPSAGVDELALTELFPGKVVHGKADGVTPLALGEPNQAILQAIELIKGDADERGTSTRMASMGTDMPSYNKTATAFQGFQRASLNKQDLVALSFAEDFLAPLYTKIFFLYQRHMDKPRTIRIEGEEIEVTKEMLQGDYRARAAIGIDVDFDDREATKAAAMLQQALAVAQAYPMLFPPEKMAELVRRAFTAYGEQAVGDLVELHPVMQPQLPPGAGGALPPMPAQEGEDALSGAPTAQPAAGVMGI